ncbi:hypothetical protein DL93DRAFT_969421 [Clavulina sp. PMI_390]|nr:hypothetical protein DL93DRAFT_969421 [Clavulina sp. PMI_390]
MKTLKGTTSYLLFAPSKIAGSSESWAHSREIALGILTYEPEAFTNNPRVCGHYHTCGNDYLSALFSSGHRWSRASVCVQALSQTNVAEPHHRRNQRQTVQRREGRPDQRARASEGNPPVIESLFGLAKSPSAPTNNPFSDTDPITKTLA